jgi:hypothetical protein
MSDMQHLWVALSPHGYGHAGMTAPVVAEIMRRRPDLHLTVQTALPLPFLRSRFGDGFSHVAEITDFGMRMTSATGIALDESALDYQRLHADWPRAVEREAERLAAARPDAVLANVPYVTIAAAGLAGIPVVAMSSLEWADIYLHYLGDRPEAAGIHAQMAEAYNSAAVFLRVTPAMLMPSLTNVADIGPVAFIGRNRREALRRHLGVEEGRRIGLIAFGGIEQGMGLEQWPSLPDWLWLSTLPVPAGRTDMVRWETTATSFTDLVASVDVVVTKPGYGTFTEAAMVGTPVLFTLRPDWPECPHLDDWLRRHTKAHATRHDELFGPGLEDQLRTLFSMPDQQVAYPGGVSDAATVVEAALDGKPIICARS